MRFEEYVIEKDAKTYWQLKQKEAKANMGPHKKYKDVIYRAHSAQNNNSDVYRNSLLEGKNENYCKK